MKNFVERKKLRSVITFATEQNYVFFHDAVPYRNYHCLFSAAVLKEDVPDLNLCMGDTVIVSPMTDENNSGNIVYKAALDIENGMFIPIISLALEFAGYIVDLGIPVCIEGHEQLIEFCFLQVWKYENITISDSGVHIDLQNPASWTSIIKGKIRWDDCDSLACAEAMIHNGAIKLPDTPLLHAHVENLDCFRRAGVSKELILDW